MLYLCSIKQISNHVTVAFSAEKMQMPFNLQLSINMNSHWIFSSKMKQETDKNIFLSDHVIILTGLGIMTTQRHWVPWAHHFPPAGPRLLEKMADSESEAENVQMGPKHLVIQKATGSYQRWRVMSGLRRRLEAPPNGQRWDNWSINNSESEKTKRTKKPH